MQVKPRRYPYPVLSFFSDDVVNCVFQSAIKPKGVTKSFYELEAFCKTSNQDLKKLIKEQKAYYAIHIECPVTRYRKIVSSYEEAFSFSLAASEVETRLQICSFIIATEDISHYSSKYFHQDYGKTAFVVRKGEVLAVAEEKTLDISKKVDPLKKFPSIFIIVKDNSETAPGMDVDTNGGKIVIKLSTENFDKYKSLSLNQNVRPLTTSIIVMPALISVLEQIKTQNNASEVDYTDYESRKWFIAIEKRLKELGTDISVPNAFVDSPILLAQKMIGEPITYALKALEDLESED